MTTHIREFDTNGKYVDNRIHVVKSDKMKYIWAEGKRECAPSGVRIHIRWEGTMNQSTIDLNQVDCRGIGAPIFRLAGTDLCYTRPFGVERTWNKTRCALRCGGAGGVCDVARRYCLDNNGNIYWSNEPTLENYPRQDKRAQYNRSTTNNPQQVNLQPALAQSALPQPILPQPVLSQPALAQPASNNDTAPEADISAVRLGKRKIREVEEDVVEEDEARVQKRARHLETAQEIQVTSDFDIQNHDLSTATPEAPTMAYTFVHSLSALDDEEVTEALLAGPNAPAHPSRNSSSSGGESPAGGGGPPSVGVSSSAGRSSNSSAPAPVELSLEEILRDNPLTLEEDGFTIFVPATEDAVLQWEMERFIQSLRS